MLGFGFALHNSICYRHSKSRLRDSSAFGLSGANSFIWNATTIAFTIRIPSMRFLVNDPFVMLSFLMIMPFVRNSEFSLIISRPILAIRMVGAILGDFYRIPRSFAKSKMIRPTAVKAFPSFRQSIGRISISSVVSCCQKKKELSGGF